MLVNWFKNIDAALEAAKSQNKPLLIDFSAAPASGACARLEAESYSATQPPIFISQLFVPHEAHIKEPPLWFKRFGVVWTPTVLVMDPEAAERYRLEGSLPMNWFRARLEMGLARVAFM